MSSVRIEGLVGNVLIRIEGLVGPHLRIEGLVGDVLTTSELKV